MTPQATEIGVKHESAPPTSKPPSAETPAKPPASSAAPPARGRDVFAMLRSEIDRLFDDFARPGAGWPRALTLPSGFGDLSLSAPAMDFVANDGSYELRVDMPGLKPEEIELKLDDGRLKIRGESSSKRETHEGDYVVQERSSGRLERTITLPRGVDPDRIDAVLSDGVLTVTLPKTTEAREKDRRIAVKAQ
ncbi:MULTISPECIES: Hsp20/alpha crystallin family protein [Thioclava]|uniref:Hsp20/alpha crystallin family protein n=1 Tax=Thioclava TaxID=285107 RepID=UPI001412B627|nr:MULTISPECIES: Hsp20/alpha crystallin family protein [Thioclava]WGT50323.1 Hsp20/alpha crystallin family protein [Thioclava nitratireducens]